LPEVQAPVGSGSKIAGMTDAAIFVAPPPCDTHKWGPLLWELPGVAEEAPYIVRQCRDCMAQDWEPKDKELWAFATAGGTLWEWRYSAMYRWRRPSRGSWAGYGMFPPLRWWLTRRMAKVKTYEEGERILDRWLPK
jgi:hypothetical protein